ncbi:MAG: acetylornithine/succinylornithine family transaminase [Acutalibacteraceae bacterium]
MNFEEIKNDEQKYLMHTYGRFNVAIVSGKGATAWDAQSKEYIDFTSGIGVNSLGYCDDSWVKAVTAQVHTLQHISNLYYSPLQTEVAKKLCTLTGFDKAFLCNSGAEANECAIKLARKYSFEKYGKERNKIVTLVNSFHGRTITTLAATGQDVFHDYFFPFTEGFVYVEANDDEQMKKALEDETVCAVFIELIQGEGGINILDKAYVQQLAEYCAEKDILLMVDEVQTGISRTGAFFCYQNYEIQPDVVTSAKGIAGGLPMGACLCNQKLSQTFTGGTHGTTFGGNPVACAGAIEVLNRVSTDAFLTEVKAKGEYISNKLKTLPNVKEVRGMGMMIGIVLENGNAKDIAAACVENGLLILTAKTLLRLLPPLTITYQEIDKGVAILKKVLEEYK